MAYVSVYALAATLAECVDGVTSCDDTDFRATLIVFGLLILGGILWRVLNGPDRS